MGGLGGLGPFRLEDRDMGSGPALHSFFVSESESASANYSLSSLHVIPVFLPNIHAGLLRTS